MERGINVIALVKDAERYIFLYDNDSSAALMQTLRRTLWLLLRTPLPLPPLHLLQPASLAAL